MSNTVGTDQQNYARKIAAELKLRPGQVAAALALLDEDATIPFIARYRKEATGNLDEVAITDIRNRIEQLRELDKRRAAILKSLSERDLLTDELEAEILSAETMAVLEDTYLPYRPKRRTRAQIARERGLEPLAELILTQDRIDVEAAAAEFIDEEKEVRSAEDALAGARDIIAEWINEDSGARAEVRRLFHEKGYFITKAVPGKQEEGAKYKDYFDWKEPVRRAASHRILAMRRGETDGILSLKIAPPAEDALAILENIFLISDNAAGEQVRLAIEDSYKRLMAPSLENELRAETKQAADAEAISVFALNLRELLMGAPLGAKRVMAIDPGFRTGCKVVCLDKQGALQQHATIFPFASDREQEAAAQTTKALVDKHKINVIAVGNGTASRETEKFIRSLGLPSHVDIEIVNEAGASVYSASDVARREFPDHDVTVRGSVSIGRRLQDPLAEFVKIEPKAIGVGQYQHDVDQAALKRSLDDTVMSCVNAVGVEINTASRELLTYVSGLGPSLADRIVEYRTANGPFKSRKELSKVPRLGPKAFEQAAGFLRISDAANPLDRSAVHPESYPVVERMARDLGCTIEQLMNDESLRSRLKLEDYITEKTGLLTLEDIMAELARPGRDPRGEHDAFRYDDRVQAIDDLKVDMVLPGVITNVTNFGAFVDIGVHQDGLVHISQLADKYVSHPSEVVRVRQQVKVRVLDVDVARGRISLSMREDE
jgi:uncharacterized protein